MVDDALIPPMGARAARILLDAVISQSSSQPTEANIKAMAVALSALTSDDAPGPDGTPAADGSSARPDPSDVVGASVVCISWLAAHLAVATSVDLEDVIADLRGFLDSVSTAQDSH